MLLATTRWLVLGGLAILFGIIATLLLMGDINTRYLLHGSRHNGTHYFSPERVQLLIATLAVAAAYLEDASTTASHGTLPDVPRWWLSGLGGSQSIYLAGKALRRFGIRRS